jgi:hypothetical protein
MQVRQLLPFLFFKWTFLFSAARGEGKASMPGFKLVRMEVACIGRRVTHPVWRFARGCGINLSRHSAVSPALAALALIAPRGPGSRCFLSQGGRRRPCYLVVRAKAGTYLGTQSITSPLDGLPLLSSPARCYPRPTCLPRCPWRGSSYPQSISAAPSVSQFVLPEPNLSRSMHATCRCRSAAGPRHALPRRLPKGQADTETEPLGSSIRLNQAAFPGAPFQSLL